MKNITYFDIKFSTILKILLTLLVVWCLIKLQDIIIMLFIAFVIATAVRPTVKKFYDKYKIPKTLSVICIYIFVLAVLIGLLYLIARPVAQEIVNFSKNLPGYIDSLGNTFPIIKELGINTASTDISSSLNTFGGNISNSINTAFSFVGGIFNLFTSILTVIIISIYLCLDMDKITNTILKFIPESKRQFIKDKIVKTENQIGSWVRGQLFLMFFIGVITYILLLILQISFGMKYALPLAIFAGLLEILPMIGPLVYSIVIILVALTVSPIAAIMAAIACFIIQQAENNLIVPQIMKKAVGLSPIATIIAILAGGTLLGIVGALLAVPVVAVVSTIIQDIYEK